MANFNVNALPAPEPDWGNTAENVAEIVVPKGTIFREGFVAPIPEAGLDGLGNQIYITRDIHNGMDDQWRLATRSMNE